MITLSGTVLLQAAAANNLGTILANYGSVTVPILTPQEVLEVQKNFASPSPARAPRRTRIRARPGIISHVSYKIYDENRKPTFVDTVSASYTEGFSALPAVARVQHSAEGAVRANFDQFLRHLAAQPPTA